MQKYPRILVIGANPALQHILVFDKIAMGEVNRASSIHLTAGGKGANFAKAARIAGSRPFLYQFAGGGNGNLYLKEIRKLGIQSRTVRTQAETRSCTTCIETARCRVTEHIGPSESLTISNGGELLRRIESDMSRFDAVAICGTCPPGLKDDFYGNISGIAVSRKIPLFLDAVHGIRPVLESGVELLKINSGEIISYTGCSSVRGAAERILDRCKVKAVAVTAGGDASWIFSRMRASKFIIPHVKVLNSIGAGDTVSGVLVSEYLANGDLAGSFRKALAAGSASCLTVFPGIYDPGQAEKIYREIIVS